MSQSKSITEYGGATRIEGRMDNERSWNEKEAVKGGKTVQNSERESPYGLTFNRFQCYFHSARHNRHSRSLFIELRVSSCLHPAELNLSTTFRRQRCIAIDNPTIIIYDFASATRKLRVALIAPTQPFNHVVGNLVACSYAATFSRNKWNKKRTTRGQKGEPCCVTLLFAERNETLLWISGISRETLVARSLEFVRRF